MRRQRPGGGKPRLELRGISKRYPGVIANDAVSLTVGPGEIHAILGENGAGKSTLMKIVYGTVQPDAGEILIDGRPAVLDSPRSAREHGIAMVFQHFSLFEAMTVAENVWLGQPKDTTLAQMAERIRSVGASYGLEIDPQRPVWSLSVGERQRVEIVRSLMLNPRLLILDEPTSVLTPAAVQKLFGTLRQLAAEGCSILYISHKLEEIRALCHHCTVMRQGRVTGECDPAAETPASLSAMMLGAEPPPLWNRPSRPGIVALRVRELTLPPADEHGVALDRVSFHVRAGEVLGIAGVSGSGQGELLRVLSGEDLRAPAGSVRLINDDIGRVPPQPRRIMGLRTVPEERLGRGAVPELPLQRNTLLTRNEPVQRFGMLDLPLATLMTSRFIERFRVVASGPDALAQSLSGGNLQKFIIGREIDASPRVLVVAQPTWGVDVGAARMIRTELLALRDAGCALVVISEELDELFEISDRLVVMAGGRVSPSVRVAEANPEQIGLWMGGGWDEAGIEEADDGASTAAASTGFGAGALGRRAAEPPRPPEPGTWRAFVARLRGARPGDPPEMPLSTRQRRGPDLDKPLAQVRQVPPADPHASTRPASAFGPSEMDPGSSRPAPSDPPRFVRPPAPPPAVQPWPEATKVVPKTPPKLAVPRPARPADPTGDGANSPSDRRPAPPPVDP